MKWKKIRLAGAISGRVMVITTLLLMGRSILGMELSDSVAWLLGVLDLAAVAVFAFSVIIRLHRKE